MSYDRVIASYAIPRQMPLQPCEFSIGCFTRLTDGEQVKVASIALDFTADPAAAQAYKPAVVLESWEDVSILLEALVQAALHAWGTPPGLDMPPPPMAH